MKCLTEQECAEWLRTAEVVERPYQRPEPFSCCSTQFAPPRESSRLFAFLRALLPIFAAKGEILLQVVDTEIPYPEQFALLDTIRRQSGEQRPIWEVPGLLFSGDEFDLALGVFGLTTEFQWEVYAYFGETKDILLNWEGDLIDLWCFDRARFDEGLLLIRSFQLRETQDAAA